MTNEDQGSQLLDELRAAIGDLELEMASTAEALPLALASGDEGDWSVVGASGFRLAHAIGKVEGLARGLAVFGVPTPAGITEAIRNAAGQLGTLGEDVDVHRLAAAH